MRAFVGLFGALALAGCTTTNVKIDKVGKFGGKLELTREAQVVLAGDGLKLPDGASTDAVLIFLAKQKPAAERGQAVADATARALILNSDMQCEHYMASFIATSRTTTSALSVSSLALSSAAGVTTPVRSANLLSAISAFASGSQEKLKSTVIANQAPELIYKAVMAERRQERARLLALLESDDLGPNAPGVVIAQLADYHGTCGPTIGINSLTTSVQGTADGADDKGARQAKAFVDSVK